MTHLPSLQARRQSLFWRIHFWAALIASPFALVASLTGILYIFTPQIERLVHGHLDEVAVAGRAQALDELVRSAQASVPQGLVLKSVVAPAGPAESVRVYFSPGPAGGPSGEHESHHAGGPAPFNAAGAPSDHRISQGLIVYLDPYTGQVLGSHGEMDRFNLWARRLHSSLLQGDGWRWMIELSASWLMVMLVTGVYLWWPRGARTALPQPGAKGRVAWKQWHAITGVALSVMSLAILTTGLTWSQYAGDQIRAFRDAIGQAPPAAPKGLQSSAPAGQAALSWDAVWQVARAQAPTVSLELTPPRGAQGVWRVSNFDRSQPEKRVNMVIDAYTGRTLHHAGWAQQTVFSKATAIGIPFHRGEFGGWNQALLLVFGLGVLFSLLSGWVMFFKRRRQGRAGLPRLQPGAWRSMPLGGWLTAVVMCVAMPLLAVSAALVAALEVALFWRQRRHAGPHIHQ
jgi:uncharacterized iron-regulated membrane protein